MSTTIVVTVKADPRNLEMVKKVHLEDHVQTKIVSQIGQERTETMVKNDRFKFTWNRS